MNYKAKPINFKLGDYISQSIEIFKKDAGDYIIAFLITCVLSIIPLCSLMALGNFYKFCRAKRERKNPTPSEIFNFDDFSTYLVFQLVLVGIIIALCLPLLFFSLIGSESGSYLIILYMIILIVLSFYIIIKSFYMIGLISLERVTDINIAWNMSKEMSKGNTINIILFSFIISFISQLGVLLCVIGVILTIPLGYIMNYLATEDGIQQIKKDEINEIGQQ